MDHIGVGNGPEVPLQVGEIGGQDARCYLNAHEDYSRVYDRPVELIHVPVVRILGLGSVTLVPSSLGLGLLTFLQLGDGSQFFR